MENGTKYILRLMKLNFLVLIILPFIGFSQLNNIKRPILKINGEKPSNLSINTLKLIESQSTTKDSISLFIKLKEDCSFDLKSSFFKHVLAFDKNWFTATVNIADINKIKLIDCILYADVGNKKALENNHSTLLSEVNVDLVHGGVGLNGSYLGEGVIIGILDDGFDFTHPNFKDENGNLRITRFWDMHGNEGDPPFFNGEENVGSEYVGEEDILEKAYDTNDYSHGTLVAGIAGGINGVAPKSELIFVNPQTPSEVSNAIKYLIYHSQLAQKPLVINFSAGFGYGETAMDNLIENQNWDSSPGLIIVKSAGNNGGENSGHVKLDFSGVNTNSKFLLPSRTDNDEFNNQIGATVKFISEANGSESAYEVTVGVYDMGNDEWDSELFSFNFDGNYINNTYTIIEDDLFFDTDIFEIEVESLINQSTNRIESTIKVITTDNNNVDDKLVLIVNSNDQVIHAWNNPHPLFEYGFRAFDGYSFEPGDNHYSITSPGSSSDLITVGSYNLTEPLIGDLSNFSSIGPTINEVTKPDISAPGNQIYSSVNSFQSTYNYNEYDYNFGTSFAAPVVTGVIALWLEQDPTLTKNEIEEIFEINARKDSYTGEVYPNNYFGHGKIDALNWLATLGHDETNIQAFKIYPNPSSSNIYLDPYGPYEISIYDLFGKKLISTKGNQINISELNANIYFLEAIDPSGKIFINKLIKK